MNEACSLTIVAMENH